MDAKHIRMSDCLDCWVDEKPGSRTRYVCSGKCRQARPFPTHPVEDAFDIPASDRKVSRKDNRRPRLIALYSPAAGSGKSEVSSVLEREFGFQVVKFAGPLKDMVRGLLRGMGQFDSPTIERMIEGDLKEAPVPGFRTVTPRHLMQTLGTNWGREAVEQNLWVKVAQSRVNALLKAGMPVVIDDLRFPNEYAMVTAFGGKTVRILRPDPSRDAGETRYEGLLEREPFDVTIHNEKTLDALHDVARRLVA